MTKVKSINLSVIAMGLALTGCTNMVSGELTPDEIEVSGQIGGMSESQSSGAQKIAANLASQAAASDYAISCMTLSSPAQTYSASIMSDGKFSLRLPAGTGVGCFVINVADQVPVASLYIEAEQKTMGTSLSSSLNLSKDVDLGELNIDFENKEIRIPKSRVDEASTPVKANKLKLEDLHDQTYKLKCVKTGNEVLDAECVRQLEADNANNTVYFRTLKAVQDGHDIDGMGVWESKTAFNACGGIDLSWEDAAGAAENDNITFPYADKIIVGGDFTPDSVSCPLRNPNGHQNSWMNIRKYFALGGVEKSADGYTLHTESEQHNENGCTVKHNTIVHFSGKSADKLTGQLYSTNVKYEHQIGACEGWQIDGNNNFIIELTKQ